MHKTPFIPKNDPHDDKQVIDEKENIQSLPYPRSKKCSTPPIPPLHPSIPLPIYSSFPAPAPAEAIAFPHQKRTSLHHPPRLQHLKHGHLTTGLSKDSIPNIDRQQRINELLKRYLGYEISMAEFEQIELPVYSVSA
jgi:hypothetical protein